MTGVEEPGWKKVAADLAQRIRDGAITPGAALPSIPQLIADYQVTESMARRAIQELRVDGLATTRPGIGTFVVSDPPEPLSQVSELAQQVADLRAMVLELRDQVEELRGRREQDPVD